MLQLRCIKKIQIFFLYLLSKSEGENQIGLNFSDDLVLVFKLCEMSVLLLKPKPTHRHLESISSTCLRAAFYAHRSSKHKKLFDLTVFFALLGSAHVKAACNMLVKLTPSSSSNLKHAAALNQRTTTI